MRVIMWHMAKEGKRSKLHKVAAPTVQEMKTVSFQLAENYAWDSPENEVEKGVTTRRFEPPCRMRSYYMKPGSRKRRDSRVGRHESVSD